jgi:3-deoxy-D-manno-octulosonate 8-phosphate phosphatase (KDO 8-P phosphatase)
MDISALPEELVTAAARIRLLLMDCDGVLTDGRLYFGESGEVLKVFDTRDGQGIVNWHSAGFRSGIISGRNSSIVELRGRQLGVEFFRLGRKEKASAFEEIISEAGVEAKEAAYIGDDTPDIPVMRLAGFSAAVGDALDEVKSSAHYVTHRYGGRGAVREFIDLILQCKSV